MSGTFSYLDITLLCLPRRDVSAYVSWEPFSLYRYCNTYGSNLLGLFDFLLIYKPRAILCVISHYFLRMILLCALYLRQASKLMYYVVFLDDVHEWHFFIPRYYSALFA
jgi:hypothetical protein